MPPAVKPIPSYTSRLRSTPMPTARSTMVSAPLPWRDQAAFGPQGDRLPGLVGPRPRPGATGEPAGDDHHARRLRASRSAGWSKTPTAQRSSRFRGRLAGAPAQEAGPAWVARGTNRDGPHSRPNPEEFGQALGEPE